MLGNASSKRIILRLCPTVRRCELHQHAFCGVASRLPFSNSYTAIAPAMSSWMLSLRFFFAQTETTPPEAHPMKQLQQKMQQPQQSAARSYQETATKFLNSVRSGKIMSELVTQKVEECLLQCVSDESNRVPSDGPLALDLLNVGISHADLSKRQPIPRLFSLACQIMVRCGHPKAFEEVNRQLWRLLDGHEQFLNQSNKRQDIVQNSHHVNDACSQLIHYMLMKAVKEKKLLSKRSIEELRDLIERLEQYHAEPSIPLVGDGVIEDAIVLFLCYQGKPREALERVQSKLRARKRTDIIPYQPFLSTFTSIISSFAKTNQPEESREVLQWMMNEQIKGSNSVVPPPNEACFNALLHAYAVAGGEDAGYRAEETLKWMDELHVSNAFATAPDSTSFNVVINAWARSNHPDAATHAENILQQMIELSEAGHDIRPTAESWSSVMHAWVNSRHPRSMERITAILDYMERLVDDGSEMSDVCYTIYVKAWENEGHRKPGRYNIHQCTDKILQVVDRIKGKGRVPSPELLNAVLTAITELTAVNGVLYFLELERQYRQGEVRLVTRTFNIGLNAIASLNRGDAEEKAFDTLSRMKEYAKIDPDVAPSNLTFNIILKVLSRSHAPDAAARADDLLREADSMSLLSPDSTSYLTCIIAWGRSPQADKFERVKDVLNRFVQSKEFQAEKHDQGAVKVFNAALSVCHHNSANDHINSVRTAIFVMKELRKRKLLRPDHITYMSFFRVFDNVDLHMFPDSPALLRILRDEFVHCIDDGMVVTEIVRILTTIDLTILIDVIGKDLDLKSFSVPINWSRNVSK
jgi:hypothetical protein